MKQTQTYHGGKEVKDCYIRLGKTIYKPVVEGEPEREVEGTYPSISQAKHRALKLMKSGQQIRRKF